MNRFCWNLAAGRVQGRLERFRSDWSLCGQPSRLTCMDISHRSRRRKPSVLQGTPNHGISPRGSCSTSLIRVSFPRSIGAPQPIRRRWVNALPLEIAEQGNGIEFQVRLDFKQTSSLADGTQSLFPFAAERPTSHSSRTWGVCKTQLILPWLNPSSYLSFYHLQD